MSLWTKFWFESSQIWEKGSLDQSAGPIDKPYIPVQVNIPKNVYDPAVRYFSKMFDTKIAFLIARRAPSDDATSNLVRMNRCGLGHMKRLISFIRLLQRACQLNLQCLSHISTFHFFTNSPKRILWETSFNWETNLYTILRASIAKDVRNNVWWTWINVPLMMFRPLPTRSALVPIQIVFQHRIYLRSYYECMISAIEIRY